MSDVRPFDVSITVQASQGSRDTAMCHRFINFETSEMQSPDSINRLIDDYLRVLKQNEGNAVVFHKVNYETGKQGLQWTVCVVFDPKSCQKLESFFRARSEQPLFGQNSKHKQMLASDQGYIKVNLNQEELTKDPL